MYGTLERAFHRSTVGRQHLPLLRKAWSSIYSVLSIGNRVKHPAVQCYKVNYASDSDDPVQRPGSTAWSETHVFVSFPAKRAVLFALSESSVHDRPDVFLPDEGSTAPSAAGRGLVAAGGAIPPTVPAGTGGVGGVDASSGAGAAGASSSAGPAAATASSAGLGSSSSSSLPSHAQAQAQAGAGMPSLPSPGKRVVELRGTGPKGIRRPDSRASQQSWEARGRASPALARLRASALSAVGVEEEDDDEEEELGGGVAAASGSPSDEAEEEDAEELDGDAWERLVGR